MTPRGGSSGYLLKGPTIRAAVFLGFALTGLVWGWSAYHLTRQIAEIEEQSLTINKRYKSGQEVLSAIRTQLMFGSVYVRDALIDPDLTNAESYRREIQDNYRAIDDALRRYVPVFDPVDEGDRIERLRHDIDDFRATMLEVLSVDSRSWPTNARIWLGEDIVPKREAVIRAADELGALNHNNYLQQQAQIAGVSRTRERQVAQQFGIALMLSVGIGLVAVLYAGRLEKKLRLQSARDFENSQSLKRLSSQLVHAQEEERRHLSRELHDEVGQVLTAMKVELALAEHALEAGGGPAQTLQNARAMADVAFHTVRDLSHLLHPALLDDLGLPAAIDGSLRGFVKRQGISVELRCDGMDERLVPEIELAAYRIVQEALTNVGKHAHASTCRIYLQKRLDTILITIEDDGIGFDARDATPRAGLGLLGIRERLLELGGTLRIEAAVGTGTRLIAELPARMRTPLVELQERSLELEPSLSL